jgi:hypothetical protein
VTIYNTSVHISVALKVIIFLVKLNYVILFISFFFCEQYVILQGPDAVCLADYCDIYRCDIISGRIEPSFWDTALCIDDDMTDLILKCNVSLVYTNLF